MRAAVAPAASMGLPPRRCRWARSSAATAAMPPRPSIRRRWPAVAAVRAVTAWCLTTAGPHTTVAGQVFTGGDGGAANGTNAPGTGGNGGGGLLLLQGGSFTNVAGASLVGGTAGATPSKTSCFLPMQPGRRRPHHLQLQRYGVCRDRHQCRGDDRWRRRHTHCYSGRPPRARRLPHPTSAAAASAFSAAAAVINTATGVITGGVGGAGFVGTATLGSGVAGFGGLGILASGGGLIANDGQITGGAGPAGTRGVPGNRPGDAFSAGQNSFAGGSGGGPTSPAAHRPFQS